MVGSVEVTPREVVGREVGWGAETLLPSNKLFGGGGGGGDGCSEENDDIAAPRQFALQ